MKSACLSAVCAGCPELRSLSLAHCRHITTELLLQLARDAPLLHSLDLSGVERRSVVSASTLRQLSEVLGDRLTELTLAHGMMTVGGLQQLVTVVAVSSGGGGSG